MTYISDTSAQDTQIEKKRNYKLYVAVAIGIVIFFTLIVPQLSLWVSGKSAVRLENIRIAEVKKGQFIRDISVQGRVVASKRPTLYSPAQGTVTYLVTPGDTVTVGESLASIDSPELTSLLAQEKSELTRLQTQLDREKIQVKKQDLEQENYLGKALVALNAAKREMRRNDEGHKNQVVSDIDFQKAKDDLENAQREYRLAVKEVALLKESQKFEIKTRALELEAQQVIVTELQRQVASLSIVSPVAGIVGNLAAEQKNSVTKNQPLLSVVDLSQYEVEVNIPENYADDLALGMGADLMLNGNVYKGELTAISPEIVGGQVEGKIRFKEKNIKGLRQNQRLTSRVVLEEKSDVFYLPRGQFTESGGGRFVYVVEEDIAVKKSIKLGSKSLGQVEVISGLAMGEKVVISDLDVFKEAGSVRIVQ
ncbi:efflux RND transporter periplasmic adaptor subunit [Pseudoalteromonas luteoviolacea]|uniref:Hemolysin D n=1 Tax=Pseudoalteromonas luteoviolacea S4054 TaxID=1129367 RepID=A0A0F6A712_9GAMM|nr:HlyD family efflux transporter periplasmic adaptor subunit [Pseudoalteromonas luteoviolacea]AOT10997.1 efflux transporter periplasmic adaptor subunit [Pseudoalteromonas luteoviolacea]AOT15839.1 efflux transporter periplasmic adaptor subunit [Pseudoalteromonas luteoviolacea]AOT20818.1 efflux transporter periplasmic adaptor subunit [Pseudoalteromonas luteoviolacea]KKE81898.1 hemolysin D [Pseudoalteromonas luteoviolacea S4054]KZN72229.1 hemolysin D [Pseudoalteromonas luteoviolacea S4047-1]